MTARTDGKLGWYTRDGERLPDDATDHLVARYATEEEAMRGHLRILDALRAGAALTDL